jgi:putative ABC transport system substrate-binding protein
MNNHQKASQHHRVKEPLAFRVHQKRISRCRRVVYYRAFFTDSYRRVAYFVDRIPKGAKPADLPVEQPMKFEFIINLKAAKQIGLTIPPEVLARASRLIK